MTPLYPPLNAFILEHTARLFLGGFDKLSSASAPACWDAVAAYIEAHGRVGVSADHSDRTVYGDPHVNHCFRAWHDWTHYLLGPQAGEFNLAGERATLEAQCRDMRYWWPHRPAVAAAGPSLGELNRAFRAAQLRLACRLLHAEVIGQLEYRDAHNGEFPVDQQGFVVAYLADPADALGRKW